MVRLKLHNIPYSAFNLSNISANIWIKAVELIRLTNPSEVTALEEEWGDYLVKSRQLDAAINHYIEAGKTLKALKASIGAAQWKKAIHIMQIIDEPDILQKYSNVIAKHYFNNKVFANYLIAASN